MAAFPHRLILLAMLVLLMARTSPAQLITVNVTNPTHPVSPTLFGAFFEEINLAGDGGLYAELVRNRSFNNAVPYSSSTNSIAYWTLVTLGSATGQIAADFTNPLNTTGTSALKLTMLSGAGSVGAANGGYFGIPLKSGSSYNLSLYMSGSSGFNGPVTVQLESASGNTVYAQTSFTGITTAWQKFTATMVPTVSDTNAQIVVSISQIGTVWLDVVSLFPQATFNNRPNGLRADLAGMVQAMHPAFLRFPGGNFIEGYELATSERWKTTVGDVSTRPGHWNSSWKYLSTDGLGFIEYLEFCEDLGMQPLFDINDGQSLSSNGSAATTVTGTALATWVQDAADAVQFASGGTSTNWGAQRAADGQTAPFTQPYMEIGNETSGTIYDEHYQQFYLELTSSYPGVTLISPDFPINPPDMAGTEENTEPLDIVDQHYYLSAAQFEMYANFYDSYPRTSPQVFVGEYQVYNATYVYGNLSSALGEAAWMTGMERNSDVVVMASYAPLFGNVNSLNWKPDAIYYNNSSVFGTPSYYVQKMFATNTGTMELPVTISNPNSTYTGGIGCATWNTEAEFANIEVTGSGGQVLYQSNFPTGPAGWSFNGGTWNVSSTDGALQETALGTPEMATYGAAAPWTNYRLSLQARKISGAEGFLIMFYVGSTNTWVWYNVGGWSNTLNGIEQEVNGTKTTLVEIPGSVQTGVWYNISINVNGNDVLCYLNGVLNESIVLPSTNEFYVSASSNPQTNEIIIKAVNPNATAIPATVNLIGLPSISSTAPMSVMTAASGTDENSFASPFNVSPVAQTLATPSTQFTMNLPAYSVTALRVQAPVAQPQNVMVKSTYGTATISWNAAAGASTYAVERATSAGGPWTAIATGLTGGSYTDTAITPGAVYFYNVVGSNAAGSGTNSATLVAMPEPPPLTIAPQVGNNVRVSLPSTTGVTYQLQQAASLSGSTAWTNVGSPFAGTGATLTSTSGALNSASFFRFNMTLPSP